MSYTEQKTNEYVRQQVDSLTGKSQSQCCQRLNEECSPGLAASPNTTPFHKLSCKVALREREDGGASWKTGWITDRIKQVCNVHLYSCNVHIKYIDKHNTRNPVIAMSLYCN